MNIAAPPVRAGIDCIEESPRLFAGRLGLITGACGMTADGRTSIDALRQRYDLRVLLAPEHGIHGVLGPGETVTGGTEAISGLPVYSLFDDHAFSQSESEKDAVYLPPAAALAQMDTIVFDLQDVGSRYYTYASTLFYAMRAAAATGKRLVVLDRPNPIGGVQVEGNTHDPALFSFIGLTPVPIRHGMTLGELAQYYNGEFGLGCDLAVVRAAGWQRQMYYPDTGLLYTPASPNLPTMESVAVYNGTCMLEGTNVSVGRGTTTPFTVIGAPWVQPVRLADAMNALGLPGLRFAPAWFRPEWNKLAGQSCTGVRIFVTDMRAVQPVALGVQLVCALRQLHPQQFCFAPPGPDGRWHFDMAVGDTRLRTLPPQCAPQLLADWAKQAAAFEKLRAPYLLYQ